MNSPDGHELEFCISQIVALGKTSFERDLCLGGKWNNKEKCTRENEEEGEEWKQNLCF